jgi:predicted esterase
MYSTEGLPLYTRHVYGWSRRKVVLFVCGWRTSALWYRPVYLMLNLAGYKVYSYEVNALVGASPRITDYVEQVEAIAKDASLAIASQAPEAKIFTIGNSLGSEIALYIMKLQPRVRAAVLNTVRGNIAEFLWTAPSAALFKTGYISQGDYKGSLARKTKNISPHTNLDKLGDRPVLIYYSKPDKIIPRKNTEILISELRRARAKYTVRRNWILGHFGASVKNFVCAWRWLGFMRKAGK